MGRESGNSLMKSSHPFGTSDVVLSFRAAEWDVGVTGIQILTTMLKISS